MGAPEQHGIVVQTSPVLAEAFLAFSSMDGLSLRSSSGLGGSLSHE